MREIIFRGKTSGNEWEYGDLTTIGDCCFISKDMGFNKTVEANTVGQYTGLTDKNGAKIFEGDIVKETDIKHKGETQIKGKIYEIKMYKGAWIVKNHKGKLDYEKWDFLNTFAPKVEVIGNIHDNPELLDGGKQ